MSDTRKSGGGDHFSRELVLRDGRSLIESTCRHCGVVIVGSAHETLPQDEERHVAVCLKAKLARGRGSFPQSVSRAAQFQEPTPADERTALRPLN